MKIGIRVEPMGALRALLSSPRATCERAHRRKCQTITATPAKPGDLLRTLDQIISCGAQGRNRTTDTVIFSHVLYQLSYLGLEASQRPRAYRRRAAACPARGAISSQRSVVLAPP